MPGMIFRSAVRLQVSAKPADLVHTVFGTSSHDHSICRKPAAVIEAGTEPDIRLRPGPPDPCYRSCTGSDFFRRIHERMVNEQDAVLCPA
jgi:hypothetical protein